MTKLFQAQWLQRHSSALWDIVTLSYCNIFHIIEPISNRNILSNKNMSCQWKYKYECHNMFDADKHIRKIRRSTKNTSITSHGWRTSLLVGGTDTVILESLSSIRDFSARNCIRFNKPVTWKRKVIRQCKKQAKPCIWFGYRD